MMLITRAAAFRLVTFDRIFHLPGVLGAIRVFGDRQPFHRVQFRLIPFRLQMRGGLCRKRVFHFRLNHFHNLRWLNNFRYLVGHLFTFHFVPVGAWTRLVIFLIVTRRPFILVWATGFSCAIKLLNCREAGV